ncbi:Crp/Fnr family transcriptional regulator [Serinibacter salmoneus]|uniref:CRP-like cAMP-binding protein n=1 Tax=Serinibacter salmoneus TaxID=556530 RepID=A0A2A9D2W7_9MICO|nr:Crp/Fnr family transcriptional regulator [Serinibacter salmoneus]PFG20686.1 CRP-like cAMP-binding protein [Serinibacter salmoneus]
MSERARTSGESRDRATERLRLILQRLGDDPLVDFHRLERTLEIVHLERGDVVDDRNLTRPPAYFVHSGLAKTRLERAGGRPTLRFYGEGEFITGHSCAVAMLESVAAATELTETLPTLVLDELRPRPSDTVAVEPSLLVRIDTCVLEELASGSLPWAQVARGLLSITYLQVYSDLQRHVATRPEERYRNLVTDRPDLVRRLSQREIASHLGITEVSMSRIIKRVNQRVTTPPR